MGYPNPLQSSGELRFSEVVTWMDAAAEWEPQEGSGVLVLIKSPSLDDLHNHSHLPNQGGPPKKLSDWYGYAIVFQGLSFINQANRQVNTSYTSNTVTAYTSGNLSISGSGAEYQVDGGSWLTGISFVNSGSTVTLRMTSSNSLNTQVTTAVTFDGNTSYWSIKTQEANPETSVFLFDIRNRYGLSEDKYLAIVEMGEDTHTVYNGHFKSPYNASLPNAYALTSAYTNQSGLQWRFAFNFTNLFAAYPALDEIKIIVKGESAGGGGQIVSGAYSRQASGAVMNQGASSPYLPSVTFPNGGSPIGTTSFNFPIQIQPGNVGYSGNLPTIGVIRYNKITKAVTILSS